MPRRSVLFPNGNHLQKWSLLEKELFLNVSNSSQKRKKAAPRFSAETVLGSGELLWQASTSSWTRASSLKNCQTLTKYTALLFSSIIHLMGPCFPSAQMRVGCPHMVVPFTMMPRSNIVTASPPLTDIIIRQPQWSGPSPIISQVRVMYQTSGPPQYTNANTFLSEAARK